MNEQEQITAVMKILGSRTSDRKKQSSAENSKLSSATKPGRVLSEETRQRMREGQARRRAAEQAEKNL